MKVAEEALKFLNLGIESELAAYVFYRRSSKMIDDEGVRKVLDDLATDEKQHFLQLEEAYDRNVRSEMWAPYKDIMSRDGLPDIDEMMQETHKELIGKIPNLKSRKKRRPTCTGTPRRRRKTPRSERSSTTSWHSRRCT
jgi:hypothetical protein